GGGVLSQLMGLGFLVQFAPSLTSSLYASAFRTFIYTSFIMIICVLIIYGNGGRECFGKWSKVMFAGVCVSSFAFTFLVSVARMVL
ncbi:MAG: hypothetical protein FWG65_04280, partial [Turicibacter sp.]|nr:hypothetical protein [Turicibacter sp.]